MTKVLIVEDDSAISGPLVRAFTREGYDVTSVATGQEAIDLVSSSIDLMVLDLGLPDMDGLDVARAARTEGQSCPILILTARAEEVDMVVGLDAGADDYVTKPFRLAELLARVRALLRRSVSSDETVGMIKAQDVSVDISAHRAYLGDEELQLTGKEFELLTILCVRLALLFHVKASWLRCGVKTSKHPRRNWICTYRGCAANLAMMLPNHITSPPCAAWDSDSKTPDLA